MSTSSSEQDDLNRDEIIAGEYVLGVVSPEERHALEKRMRNDPAFAALVQEWEQHFSDFNSDFPEAMPPARTFARIEHRIFAEGQASTSLRPVGGIWGSLVFWRGLSLAGFLLSIGLGAQSAGLFSPLAPVSKPLIAEMAAEGSPVSLVALYDNQSGIMKLTPAAARATEKKSLELWLIDGDSPAIALGILPATGTGEIQIPPDMRTKISDGMVLAVSLEPFGGSPTGKATGPIVAMGKARNL